jgi:hypothetical protein
MLPSAGAKLALIGNHSSIASEGRIETYHFEAPVRLSEEQRRSNDVPMFKCEPMPFVEFADLLVIQGFVVK